MKFRVIGSVLVLLAVMLAWLLVNSNEGSTSGRPLHGDGIKLNP